MSDNAYAYVVVVERDDVDPLVVGFDNERHANAWAGAMNGLMGLVFPHGYHMYSRPPIRPVQSVTGTAMMLEDAIIQMEADHDQG